MRWLLAIALCAASACSPVPLGDGERLTVVKSLGGSVILPAVTQAGNAAGELRVNLEAFERSASPEDLERARAAWRRARVPWKAAAPLLFGPGRDLAGAVDWFPVERKKLDELLASADPVDAAGVALLGTSRRGFHAIELLLFDEPESGYVALAALGGTEPAALRRRAYLSALGADIQTRLGAWRAAWTGGGDHLAAFMAPGRADGPYPTIGAVVDTVVNESITAAERATALMARPLGLMSGGEPRPELAESVPSDNTMADLEAMVRGIQDLYVGPPMEGQGRGGISALVKSPGLDGRMRAALSTAQLRLQAVPRPFRAALLAKDPAVSAAHEAVREVKRLAATELVANLGATLKFNDNDGD
jgi:predicted lipoprotein